MLDWVSESKQFNPSLVFFWSEVYFATVATCVIVFSLSQYISMDYRFDVRFAFA